MDDRPAIEYHPYGTITLNFDEGPVKLRRCRLGDLQFGKDLLAEIQAETLPKRQAWAEEAIKLRDKYPPKPDAKPPTVKQLEAQRPDVDRMNELANLMENERVEIVWQWLAKVAARMGDGPTPGKDDWPVEMLDPEVPREIIDHWQSRPLASGKTLATRTAPEAANSGPPLRIVSSPPVPPPQ